MRYESFSDCFTDITGGNIKIKQSDYLAEGYLPVIDQGKNLIGGYTEKREAMFKRDSPVIIFGDHSRIIKYIEFDFALGADGVKVFKTTSLIESRYGFYYLKSIKLPKGGYERNYKYLKRLKVPIPTFEEQRRIVSILDKFQSILIKRSELNSLLNDLPYSIFFETFGDPIINPLGYNKDSLSTLGTWKSGGTPQRDKIQYFEGNIPWYKSGELTEIFISSSEEYISDLALEKSSSKKIQSGSLLIGMYDTSAFKSSITTVDATCNQAIAFSKLNETLCSSIYVYYAIQASKSYYLNLRKGVRQKNLSLKMIKDIKIPIPSLNDQNEFEQKIKRILSVREKLLNTSISIDLLSVSFNQQLFNNENKKTDIDILLEDIYEQELLINKLKSKEKEFETLEEYNTAKTLLYQLLENPSSLAIQKFVTTKGKSNIEIGIKDEINPA